MAKPHINNLHLNSQNRSKRNLNELYNLTIYAQNSMNPLAVKCIFVQARDALDGLSHKNTPVYRHYDRKIGVFSIILIRSSAVHIYSPKTRSCNTHST